MRNCNYIHPVIPFNWLNWQVLQGFFLLGFAHWHPRALGWNKFKHLHQFQSYVGLEQLNIKESVAFFWLVYLGKLHLLRMELQKKNTSFHSRSFRVLTRKSTSDHLIDTMTQWKMINKVKSITAQLYLQTLLQFFSFLKDRSKESQKSFMFNLHPIFSILLWRGGYIFLKIEKIADIVSCTQSNPSCNM
jgi:hypothetical protein